MKSVIVKNLSFKYKNSREKILDNVNLEIDSGKITAIIGKSGSGKSTLCNCICGLIPRVYDGDLSGDIFINGENLRDMGLQDIVTKVGIIFQNPSSQLFSPTIEDELAFGPENLCVDTEEIGRRIDRILQIINMEDYRYDNPNNLSGGQQQLIAIASVLMLDPQILICDEIMSWIDEDGRVIIKELLLKLKEEGKTIIMVDHEPDNIVIANQILYLNFG
jgi:energy-coupling factor transport system ATP-binding protein